MHQTVAFSQRRGKRLVGISVFSLTPLLVYCKKCGMIYLLDDVKERCLKFGSFPVFAICWSELFLTYCKRMHRCTDRLLSVLVAFLEGNTLEIYSPCLSIRKEHHPLIWPISTKLVAVSVGFWSGVKVYRNGIHCLPITLALGLGSGGWFPT
jgi:hypothetical protein